MAEGTAHSGYNEVLLTPRCGISISLSTAGSYRYYSSCVAQDVLLLSSAAVRTNEFVRVDYSRVSDDETTTMQCTNRLAHVTADDRNTYMCRYIHAPNDGAIRGAGSHVLIIALPFIGIIGTLSSLRSRVCTGFLRGFLPSPREQIALLMTQQFRLPIGYDFQPGIFKLKYH